MRLNNVFVCVLLAVWFSGCVEAPVNHGLLSPDTKEPPVGVGAAVSEPAAEEKGAQAVVINAGSLVAVEFHSDHNDTVAKSLVKTTRGEWLVLGRPGGFYGAVVTIENTAGGQGQALFIAGKKHGNMLCEEVEP